jgi:hypothetical protein
MLIVFDINDHLGAITALARPSQSFSFGLIGAPRSVVACGLCADEKDQRRANRVSSDRSAKQNTSGNARNDSTMVFFGCGLTPGPRVMIAQAVSPLFKDKHRRHRGYGTGKR